MYKLRLQVYPDVEGRDIEEWEGEYIEESVASYVPKIKGYMKEKTTGKEVVLCGYHDLYPASICDQYCMAGSGKILILALPLTTQEPIIMYKGKGLSEQLNYNTWSTLDFKREGTVRISTESIQIYGHKRRDKSAEIENKYHKMIKELPDIYRDLCRCLNFTKTYEF